MDVGFWRWLGRLGGWHGHLDVGIGRIIPSGFDGVATGGGQGMIGKKEGCGTCFSIPHERAGWCKDEQNSLSRRRQ